MRTLARQCFDSKYIDEESRRLKTGNTFFEKSLYAFELLGRLAQEGLDFVFKGGTSLMLRLPNPRRLSIDVDIVCRESSDRLERVLRNCATEPFTGQEEDKRRHNRPPRRRHWNFAYRPIEPDHCPEPYIILDVLEEDCLYPDVETVPIRTPFLTPDHEIRVRVPTADNLLADKLTAFAPETIGQEYSKGHPEKIAKHLFDIGELFSVATNLHILQAVYDRIARAEIGYRRLAAQPTDCLDNSIQTARLVTALAVNRDLDADHSPLLQRGIADLRSHLLGINFSPVDAAIAAGKVALLATIIRNRATTTPLAALRYEASMVDTIRAAKPLNDPVFAKLAQVTPEAFHYWRLVENMFQE